MHYSLMGKMKVICYIEVPFKTGLTTHVPECDSTHSLQTSKSKTNFLVKN